MSLTIAPSSSGDEGLYPITLTPMDVDLITATYSFNLTVVLCPPPVFASALVNQVA